MTTLIVMLLNIVEVDSDSGRDDTPARERVSIEPPIFVVGASRSGTSMLQAMLNRHSHVWLTRETHFFDDMRAKLPIGEVLRPDQAQRCEDYLLRIGHLPYRSAGADPAQSRVAPDELRTLARALGGTSDSYFEAFCRLMASLRKKRRWGEKTPRHVFRIDEILGAFPTAQVICLVRDPRAVLASYRDWKKSLPDHVRERRRTRQSYHVVLHSLLWRSTMRAAMVAHERHGPEHIRLQSYERLVADPESSLQELCAWLGLEYEAGMLEVPVVQSSYTMAESGIRTEPIARWKDSLSPGDVGVIDAVCGGLMVRLGYEKAGATASRLALAQAWGSLPLAFIRAAVVNRHRFGKVGNYIWRRALLAVNRSSPPPS